MVAGAAVMSFLRFLMAIRPELQELARLLYARHKGNVEAAVAEIRTIRDHGAQHTAFQTEVNRRLAELRAKERKP